MGREHAAELLFTGRTVDADEAGAIGLVSRVVPHADLLATALRTADAIAAVADRPADAVALAAVSPEYVVSR